MSAGSKFCLMLLAFLLMGYAVAEEKNQNLAISTPEQKLLLKDAMENWNKRANKDNLDAALSKFALVHEANPADLETLVYLTRGYYFMADAHTDNKDLKHKYFATAVDYGEKALATNPEFLKKMKDGKKVEDSVDVLGEKEVPAMFWMAASLGKWAREEGLFARMKNKDKMLALIKRVDKLKPDYFYGAPARFMGGFYAVAPSIAGGDMRKSKAEFEKSMKMAPEYLGTQVLMAEVYWTEKKDKKAFEEMLRAVLMSTQDKHPDIGPENAMEKKKAEKLLEDVDDLF